jgi:hypothetical protein
LIGKFDNNNQIFILLTGKDFQKFPPKKDLRFKRDQRFPNSSYILLPEALIPNFDLSDKIGSH